MNNSAPLKSLSSFPATRCSKVEVVGGFVQQQNSGSVTSARASATRFLSPPGQGFNRAVCVKRQALQGFLHPAVEPPGIGISSSCDSRSRSSNASISPSATQGGGVIVGGAGVAPRQPPLPPFEYGMAGLKLPVPAAHSKLQGRFAPNVPASGGSIPAMIFSSWLAGAVATDQAMRSPASTTQ